MSLLMIFSFSAVTAQDEMPPDAPNKQADRTRRPNLLQELSLTQDQRQQIRRINAEKRPLVRDAQQRLREANRNLDLAIYADTINEAEIASRLRDVQTAQAELSKIRFTNELAIRKVLTAEQLSKFRALRLRFAQSLENNPHQPPRRLENLKERFRRQNRMRQNH